MLRALTGKLVVLLMSFAMCLSLGGCENIEGDPQLSANTACQLVDWHITGLMFINCPVAWLRISNYNAVPIKEITVEYSTFDVEGRFLDKGYYTIEGVVPPGTMKNFIELYLGIVNLHSERLMVKLYSVKHG